MSMSQHLPITTLHFTVAELPERKKNVHGGRYLLARGHSKNGRAVTILTYQANMIEAVGALGIGETIKLRGCFEYSASGARTFRPIWLWTPKWTAEEASAQAGAKTA